MAQGQNGGRPGGTEPVALSRLEFEMALEIADGARQPLADIVRQAALAAGGDLLFVLPLAREDGEPGEQALVRLREGGENRILHVCKSGEGLAVTDQPDIDGRLLGFARASIDVLERLRADERIKAAAA